MMRVARGFTLIEVLIASVIFAQVTLVGATTLISVRRLTNQTGRLQSKQQSMRNVLETIKRDVRCATAGQLQINDSTGFSLTNDSGDEAVYSRLTDDTTANRSIVKTNQTGKTKLTPDAVDVEEFVISGVSNSASVPNPPASYVHIKIKLKSVSQPSSEDSYEAETTIVPRGQKCE